MAPVKAPGKGRPAAPKKGGGGGGRSNKAQAAPAKSKGAGVRKGKGQGGKDKRTKYDVYEDSEEEAPVVRTDRGEEGGYEYDLPANFDDEEIDEDGIFNDSDYERYGDLGNPSGGGKKESKGRRNESSASEAEEDDDFEGADAGDVMDLSELLGGASAARKRDADILGRRKQAELEDDDETEEGSDADAERHDGLLKSIGMLDGRGAGKQREVTELVAESEYNLGKTKLSMSDLLGSLKDTTSFGGLKKQLAKLENAEALSVPMAKPAKERLNRSVAYDNTAEDISKWTSVVKRNREAEHLSFPLNPPSAPAHSNAALTMKFKPETDMEIEIAEIMEAAGDADGNHLARGELLQLQELSVDEIKERRKQLAKMRALMSYYEVKRQRINKIKSKTYHKKLKREKERKAMGEGEMEHLDAETAMTEQAKAERSRAEERMTLRHKNTSKWAKRLLQRGSLDPQSKAALEEQLRLGQQLRRKITMEAGSDSDAASGDSSADEDVESDSGDEPGTSRTRAQKLVKKLEALEHDVDGVLPATGLLGMKFMQRALEKQRKQAQAELAEIKRQLENGEHVESEGDDDDYEHMERRERRRQQKRQGSDEEDEGDDDDGSEPEAVEGVGKLRDGELMSDKVAHSRGHGTAVRGFVNVDLSGLDSLFEVGDFDGSEGAHTLHMNKKAVHGKQDESDDGAEEEEEEEDSDAESEGESNAENPWLVLDTSSKAKGDNGKEGAKSQPRAKEAVKSVVAAEGRGAKRKAAEEDEEEGVFDLAKGDDEQRRLIEMAFAGDNVVEEFEAEKRLAEEGLEKAKEETVLPGWGAWAGEGVKEKKKAAKVVEKPKAPTAPRKDAALPHVIINEKRDKKAAAKTIKQLPHLFDTREQFERTIRNPVGKEWNTPSVVEKTVRPTISTKAGTVIQPMSLTKEIKVKKAASKNKKLRTG